jgi:hypothetical protein
MNANELIDCYVNDVALQLPRRQRNDVAFELRALLQEELQDKAQATGQAVNPALALALLRTFGSPRDVAARYRPSLTIVAPEDGHKFLRATVIGLAIIWVAGLIAILQQPIHSGDDLIRALAHWWASTVIPSMIWPGILVVGFGLAGWTRRRWPRTSVWTPRTGRHIGDGRVGQAMALAGILAGVFVLVDPHWLLDFFWSGRAAPSAYEALTYTEPFLQRQAPWLLLLILLNIPLMVTIIVKGRRSAAVQRLEAGLALLTCAAMVWTLLDGPAFVSPVSDHTFKTALVLLVAIVLIQLGIKRYRSVNPRPAM